MDQCHIHMCRRATGRVARLAFFMPTFSNLGYFKEVDRTKNNLLAFQPKVPTRDFLLPTNSKYPKFEKVGMKNANLATPGCSMDLCCHIHMCHRAEGVKHSVMNFKFYFCQ